MSAIAIISEIENSSVLPMSNSPSTDGSVSSDHHPTPPIPTVKTKPNLRTLDPDAEVISLSPKSLMAANRFVCEVCNKGFQRDQNLQLHRRGHNLPWKLKPRTGKELIRKKLYVCPELSCVHHNPSKALNDLTGIKKHFIRKHSEKKWNCEKCSKKFLMQSDLKAHARTCGQEYRCHCGTLFSGRASFITHRAFCDAMIQESSRVHTTRTSSLVMSMAGLQVVMPPENEEPENSVQTLQYLPSWPSLALSSSTNCGEITSTSSGGTLFASLFPPATGPSPLASSSLAEVIGLLNSKVSTTLCLSTNTSSSLPHISATGLLQKATRTGVTETSSSFRFAPSTSSSSSSGNKGSNVVSLGPRDGPGLRKPQKRVSFAVGAAIGDARFPGP